MPKLHRRPIRDRALLGRRLDELSRHFTIASLSPDPLEVVHSFDEPLDQEVVGLIAAAFAYGRADVVVRNVREIVEVMRPGPFAFVRDFDRRESRKLFRGFSHRFHKTDDLIALLDAISGAIRSHGSLGRMFESVHDPREEDIGPSLARFTAAMIEAVPDPPPSLRYLLTSPSDGSACKRMNLYLRWMVRRESPDLGLWCFVDPATLVMPLDTHVHRITTFLGLNQRKSADWKAACALTAELRKFDTADPVRFDYAICRLGILDLCSRKPDPVQCAKCTLRDVCVIRRDRAS